MTPKASIHDRIERAQERADELDVAIVSEDPLVVHVDSDHSDRVHTVVPESLHCSCEDHTYRDTVCYHLIHLMIGDDIPDVAQEAARLALTDELTSMQAREMELRAEIEAIYEQREDFQAVRDEMDMKDYGLGTDHGSEATDDDVRDSFRGMVEDLSDD